MKVAFVMPFGANAQLGKLGNPVPPAHPGPSPGTLNGPAGVVPAVPVVVACTANDEAFKSASVFRQFRMVAEGVEVSGPSTILVKTCAPTAKESAPRRKDAELFSLNSNCMPCT